MAIKILFVFLLCVSVALARWGVFTFEGSVVNGAVPPELGRYKQLNGKYYYVEGEQQVNWFEAQEICRTYGGFLVNIKSQIEMQELQTYLFALNYTVEQTQFWIDGNDLGQRSKYMSMATGQQMPYLQWGPNEPSHGQNTEFCVQLWLRANQYDMNDDTCAHVANYICELINPQAMVLTVW